MHIDMRIFGSHCLSAYLCLCVSHTPINAHTHTDTQRGTRTQIKYNKVLAACSVFFLSFRLRRFVFWVFSADNDDDDDDDEYSVLLLHVLPLVSTLYRQLYRQQLFRHPECPLN